MSARGHVPPGQYPPFATVTKDNHGAAIIVATALGIAFTLLVLMARVFIRKYVNPGWQWEDTSCVMATALYWVQSSLVLVACADGLGSSLRLIPLHLQGHVQKLFYTSNLFYLCAINLSKISILLFLRRLTAPGTNVRRYTNVLLAVTATSMAIFLLAAAFQCGISRPWLILDQRCPDWFLLWEVQAIAASLIEVAIFVAPVWLVWHLQTSSATRLGVVAWFGVRLLLIIFTATRMRSFDTAGFATNPTLLEATYICLTQAESCYAIMAATIPIARTFANDLASYYNSAGFGDIGSRSGGFGGTYQLSSLKPSGKQRSDRGYYDNAQTQAGAGEADSQELIIRRDTTIQISHDGDQENISTALP